jgi:hypothetical protein
MPPFTTAKKALELWNRSKCTINRNLAPMWKRAFLWIPTFGTDEKEFLNAPASEISRGESQRALSTRVNSAAIPREWKGNSRRTAPCIQEDLISGL